MVQNHLPIRRRGRILPFVVGAMVYGSLAPPSISWGAELANVKIRLDMRRGHVVDEQALIDKTDLTIPSLQKLALEYKREFGTTDRLWQVILAPDIATLANATVHLIPGDGYWDSRRKPGWAQPVAMPAARILGRGEDVIVTLRDQDGLRTVQVVGHGDPRIVSWGTGRAAELLHFALRSAGGGPADHILHLFLRVERPVEPATVATWLDSAMRDWGVGQSALSVRQDGYFLHDGQYPEIPTFAEAGGSPSEDAYGKAWTLRCFFPEWRTRKSECRIPGKFDW